MPDLPTFSDLFDVFAEEIQARGETKPVGQRFSPSEIYTPGSDINLIGAGAAAMAEDVIRTLGEELLALTLDGAENEELDRWGGDRYSTTVPRKAATPAVGTVQFTRPTTAAGAVVQPSGSIVRTSGGVRVETLAAASFGAGSLGPVNVPARAVEAGTAGNVDENTITAFVSAKTDPALLVTNPDVFAGGDDTETDERFKARLRAFFAAARRGVLAAIEFGALTVPGLRQAAAVELVSLPLGVPNGLVRIYVADAQGRANADLVALVETALLDFRGAGIVADVLAAVPYYQAIELDLDFATGVDTVAAFDAVAATIVARVNALAPGATLLRSRIVTAAESITGVIVPDGAVVVPAGDVVPTANQVIRTRRDLVTSVV